MKRESRQAVAPGEPEGLELPEQGPQLEVGIVRQLVGRLPVDVLEPGNRATFGSAHVGQRQAVKLHVRVVLEQDVDRHAERALELLSRQDAPVGLDEGVERVADDEADVLEAHAVDALVEGRYQLDEPDLVALAHGERLLEQQLRDRSPVPQVLDVGACPLAWGSASLWRFSGTMT